MGNTAENKIKQPESRKAQTGIGEKLQTALRSSISEYDAEGIFTKIASPHGAMQTDALYERLRLIAQSCGDDTARSIVDFAVEDNPAKLGEICRTAPAQIAKYGLEAAKREDMNIKALLSLAVCGNAEVDEAAADALRSIGELIQCYLVATKGSEHLPAKEKARIRNYMRERLRDVKVEALAEFVSTKSGDPDMPSMYAYVTRNASAAARIESVNGLCEATFYLRQEMGKSAAECTTMLVVLCDEGSDSMRAQAISNLTKMKMSLDPDEAGAEATTDPNAPENDSYKEAEIADVDLLFAIGVLGNDKTAAEVTSALRDIGELHVAALISKTRSRMRDPAEGAEKPQLLGLLHRG